MGPFPTLVGRLVRTQNHFRSEGHTPIGRGTAVPSTVLATAALTVLAVPGSAAAAHGTTASSASGAILMPPASASTIQRGPTAATTPDPLAVAQSPGSRTHDDSRTPPRATPRYEESLSSTIRCATWSGILSWGGNGSIAVPAYIQLEGVIHDNCNNGWARLYLHWDTINNPHEVNPGYAGPNSHSNTPYETEDHINTYKDIWVQLCSSDSTGYRCGNKKGPGA